MILLHGHMKICLDWIQNKLNTDWFFMLMPNQSRKKILRRRFIQNLHSKSKKNLINFTPLNSSEWLSISSMDCKCFLSIKERERALIFVILIYKITSKDDFSLSHIDILIIDNIANYKLLYLNGMENVKKKLSRRLDIIISTTDPHGSYCGEATHFTYRCYRRINSRC